MSRYPNRDRMRRPLGYTLGDTGVSLFDDPTLGSRSALEQAAGVNQAFDPGMSFGTPSSIPQFVPLDAAQLTGESFNPGSLAVPTFAVGSAPSADSRPVWLKPVLIGGLVLIGFLLLTRR